MDPENAPRPEGAVRLLTTQIEGAPYTAMMYDSPRPPDQALADYDRALLGYGWQRLELPAAEVPSSRAYCRIGQDLLVLSSPNGRASIISIFQMGSQ